MAEVERKAKFEIGLTKKYCENDVQKPRLTVTEMVNGSDDPEFPKWKPRAELKVTVDDDNRGVYITAVHTDFDDPTSMWLSWSNVWILAQKLHELRHPTQGESV